MKGRKFISALKFYSDYSKWNDKESRYENWEEACEAVINETHRVKYHEQLPLLDSYLTDALESYKSKLILASQRNLQYRGEQIFRNNSRLFNCSALYCDKVENFGKVFHLLLSGCGVGISFLNHWVKKLPVLIPRDTAIVKNFIIPDSVEGWAEAANVLLSSFCDGDVPSPEYQGAIVRFDYSQIRPKGSFINGGFKAPGPKGLKQSLERIENLLEKETQDGHSKFRSIVAYDVFMHLADAVLSGGIRRAALSIIVDQNDTEMINAKIGDWRTHNKQRSRSNNSIGLIRGQFTYQQFLDIVKMNNELSDIGFVFMDSIYTIFNPCVTGDMVVDVVYKNKKYKMRVDDAVGLHQKGEVILIKSKDLEKNEIKYSLITDALKTKKDAKILKITDTTSGKFIRVTEEHLIFTKNRGYVEARNLKQDDKLVISD